MPASAAEVARVECLGGATLIQEAVLCLPQNEVEKIGMSLRMYYYLNVSKNFDLGSISDVRI